ncbi:hypothetical protein ACFPM0_20375 [Pseudonocardia sulfidoxydans]
MPQGSRAQRIRTVDRPPDALDDAGVPRSTDMDHSARERRWSL